MCAAAINFVLIGAIIAAILFSAAWKPGVDFDVWGTHVALQNLARDAALIAIALLSLWLTPNEHREANGFSWEPIREVAILFAAFSSPSSRSWRCCRPARQASFAPLLESGDGQRRFAARGRVFLDDRHAVGLPRQCADLSRVLRARGRRCARN